MAEGPDAPAPSPGPSGSDAVRPAATPEAAQPRGVEPSAAPVAVDPADDATGPSPILAIRSISRRFGSTQALDGVSLDLHAGEIHALLGENGAGKSTLIKIMTGVEQPDSGEILLYGQPVRIGSALDGQALGIAAIYQEPMIFPDLSVAENIFISHRDRGRVVDRRQMGRDASAVLDRLGVHLDVHEPARGLTPAEQQTLEIAKAISLKVRVLILDEPTASLSAHEARRLFRIIRALRDDGVAILFISHRMEEVFEIADRVTVLRDGRWISTRPTADTSPDTAIRDMVGRLLETLFTRTPTEPGPVVLDVRRLGLEGAFSDVSFTVRAGEVVGFAGLVGARRTDVGLALFGIAPADTGEILLDGQAVRIRSPKDALRHGIAYTTEDRHDLGLIFPQSIAANISLPTLSRYLDRIGIVQRSAEEATAVAFQDRLKIRAASVKAPVSTLSGGNQQKVVLSKWLNTRPRVLILDEPTRGIDVRSKAEVHQMIDELAGEGMAIVLISSDMPEVLATSDRIVVMREGRLMTILDQAEATQERVLTAAMGRESDPTNSAEAGPIR